MPEVSRFLGRHHRPHFHAYCRGRSVVVAVDQVECLQGELERREQRLVEAWAELHQQERLDDWQLLQSGQPPKAIAPLA